MKKKWGTSPFVLAALLVAPAIALAQGCRVLDPELQDTYAGPCVNGLAEGMGSAFGKAEYHGELKAGRKHGKGLKIWPNGDRYEGEFVEDRKEGKGTYLWGAGPWQGERYEGAYLNDRRHGPGTYRYRSGDVYSGPWENDIATGPPTPMMQAQGKHEEEARVAVAKAGARVCRELPVGIANRDWIRGTVVAVAEGKVGVRIDDAGRSPQIVGGVPVQRGDVLWDAPSAWTPCL
jgi:hypothetical protein